MTNDNLTSQKLRKLLKRRGKNPFLRTDDVDAPNTITGRIYASIISESPWLFDYLPYHRFKGLINVMAALICALPGMAEKMAGWNYLLGLWMLARSVYCFFPGFNLDIFTASTARRIAGNTLLLIHVTHLIVDPYYFPAHIGYFIGVALLFKRQAWPWVLGLDYLLMMLAYDSSTLVISALGLVALFAILL